MKRIIHSAKYSVLALAAIIFIASLPVSGQSTQPPTADRQFNLLVLGDSIAWGQGLRDEHKAWYLVKAWLEANHGWQVRETVLAHSGAVIGTAGEPGGNDGPVLVCHPGGPGFSAQYFGDLAGLWERFTLVLLNPRGTGGSSRPADPNSSIRSSPRCSLSSSRSDM